MLAADAQVYAVTGISADGHLLSFLGQSATHPAPGVDAPLYAEYVSDRRTGVSHPLSKPDAHVHLLSWSPAGENFVADTGGHTSDDVKSGSCIGSGSSCRYFPDVYAYPDGQVWSTDGTAVVISAGVGYQTTLYDFDDASSTPIGTQFDGIVSAQFIGADARRLLVRIAFGQAVVWDRKTGAKTFV